MDFSKLNLEFANMQTTISKYNKIISSINIKIKENIKNINKYETKIKNTKDKLEKELVHIYVASMKKENEFLDSLIKEAQMDEREKGNIKSV
ncbi:MAG: hypothetical protein IJ565_02635 [Bacilli bacterium]|nr:hypothetical protein [Bacilli bacterium]